MSNGEMRSRTSCTKLSAIKKYDRGTIRGLFFAQSYETTNLSPKHPLAQTVAF